MAVVTQAYQRAFMQMMASRGSIQARYDAAVTDNEAFINHWANADNLSPNAANDYTVRRRIRSRSRFEVIENNPYLKGMLLTIANDFVGKGPKLKITDKRLSEDRRRHIERLYRKWMKKSFYRRKLWQLRMSKITDGEGIKLFTLSGNRRMTIRQTWKVMEADQMTTEHMGILPMMRTRTQPPPGIREIDGVRLGPDGEATEYYFLDEHPGEATIMNQMTGKWVPAPFVTHWFRRDRPWNRGISEIVTSLPLCALMRRYTLATVKAAETAADFAAVLESQLPPNTSMYSLQDMEDTDNAFDTIPIEQGMFTVLPWGYKLGQMDARHPGQMYNVFIDTLLREISRPLLMPFNLSAGSSQDSNMASGVVDIHQYKKAQDLERVCCEEEVLEDDLDMWWIEAVATGDAFEPLPGDSGSVVMDNPDLMEEPPEHEWGWDQVISEHTDPQKVQAALEIAKRNHFLTDRDIQEQYHNRSYEDWQEEIREEKKFRDEIEPEPVLPDGSTPAKEDDQIDEDD